MSNLTSLEKRKFEKFLGMGTGYVLDFSNRSFAEFVLGSTGHHIFDVRYEYASGSKANRLRAFWQREDNAIVGKLMDDMLDYSEAAGAELEVCRLIVARLLKESRAEHSSAPPSGQSPNERRRSDDLQHLKEAFFQLAAYHDRNRAGLELERLLNRLFAKSLIFSLDSPFA